jgi:esterase FrsA
MPVLAEAKQFVELHARHMGLGGPYINEVLGRIKTIEGEAQGSWLGEWVREAQLHAGKGEHQTASNLYNLARFPYADSPAKQQAAQEAARSLTAWLSATGAGERRVAVVDGVSVPFLFRRGPRKDSPLVVLMGGIVSLKEQWGGFLGLVPRIGCAIAIADFPGVGENGLHYTRGAAKIFGAIMDATAGSCDSRRTLAVAPSFGGYLAMVQSLEDSRLKGLVTVGSPIARFFQDPSSRATMPVITRAALRHTSGVDEAGLEQHLGGLALSQAEISALPIPVLYVASLRDEIIPQREWRDAMSLNSKFQVYAFDDVHGSPHHLKQTRFLILSALCRHAGRERLARVLSLAGSWALRLKPLSSHHPSA